VSAQPLDEVERFPQLAAIAREREEAMRRAAGPDPRPAEPELTETRVTITYRRHDGERVTVDLDDVSDEELPQRIRRWRPARAYAVIEDIRFMAETGATLRGVADRLSAVRGKPITADSVERLLHRYGAHELVWQLKAAEEGEPAPDSPDWFLEGRHGDGRSARSRLSPEEFETARREWVQGRRHSQENYPQPTPGTTLRSTATPFYRLARGQAVRGRRL
jgi:hypothetical protein